MKMILKVFDIVLSLHSQHTEYCYQLAFIIQIIFCIFNILLSLYIKITLMRLELLYRMVNFYVSLITVKYF